MLQVKDIEIESQQKKIECFMTKVRDLNQKLKGNPDHLKLEQYQKTIAELRTKPQHQKDPKSNPDDMKLEQYQKTIAELKTELQQQKDLKSMPDDMKLEQYQKNIAELKAELQQQKDLKSNSYDLKLEEYQKTISELKTELKQQKDLVLELKNENNHLNRKLRSNRVNPDKLQQKNIEKQRMELQQQKDIILELRKEIIYWINEKKFQSTTNANQRYVVSQNEIPNDEDMAEQPPINTGMQSPNQETPKSFEDLQGQIEEMINKYSTKKEKEIKGDSFQNDESIDEYVERNDNEFFQDTDSMNLSSDLDDQSSNDQEDSNTEMIVDFMNPIKIKSQKDETKRCKICLKTFSGSNKLKIHMDAVHKKLKPFQCTICQSPFALKAHLKSHVDVVHNKLKPVSCKMCSRTFACHSHLKQHAVKVHKNARPFECNSCSETFPRNSDLKQHVEQLHNNI